MQHVHAKGSIVEPIRQELEHLRHVLSAARQAAVEAGCAARRTSDRMRPAQPH